MATTQKKMKKTITSVRVALLSFAIAATFTSCMTTKTNVGAYRETQGSEYTFAKGKQIWLFGGLIPIGRTSVSTPGDGNCQVITKFNLGDFLISGLTGGLITTQTIKVKAKRKN